MAHRSDGNGVRIGRMLGSLLPVACVVAGCSGGAVAQSLPASASAAGVRCPPLPAGGAAPPSMLPADAAAQLRELLRPYRADALDATSARALKQALCNAGLWQQAAGRRAVADAGFDVRQIDQLAPDLATSPTPPPAAGPRASGRQVPRPE